MMIDLAVIVLVSFLMFEPTALALGVRAASETLHKVPFSIFILRTYGVWGAFTLIVSWLYYSLSESSRFQATIGKRLLGLLVFTQAEGRLDFQRASRRFWSKLVSAAPAFGGFFLFFFDPKRRTLHDRLSRTIVLQAHPRLAEANPNLLA